jgi:hypothetical protein
MTEQVEKQQSLGAKRPQGSKKVETDVSHAVTGSLLEQEDVLKSVTPQEAPRTQQGSSDTQRDSRPPIHTQSGQRAQNNQRSQGGQRTSNSQGGSGRSQSGSSRSQNNQQNNNRGRSNRR